MQAEILESKKIKNNNRILLISFILIPIILFVYSFATGQYEVSPIEFVKVLLSKVIPIEQTWEPQVETVIFKIRLPRILAAMLVGGSLSCAGASYQGMFKNPLVSSDVLGASAGAGFGAALAILLSLSFFGIQVLAFIFGITAVAIVYIISSRLKDNSVTGLVLTGMLIGTLFSSATSLLKYMADPYDDLPSITYWLMGSLAKVDFRDLKFACIPIIIGLIPILIVRWKINVLTMGEDEAESMGINIKALRTIIIICATLMTVGSVSISGNIGWVGLVVPHLCRMIVGHNFKILIPTSIVMGSCYMLVVDNLARMISTAEIPLGILTSFVGAPLFIYLIINRKRSF